MRNLSQLYIILLDFYNNLRLDSNLKYICNAIGEMKVTSVITEEEYVKLFAHFKSQKPTKELNSEFLTNIACLMSTPNQPWWYLSAQYMKEGVELRQRFIQKMISTTKQQNI